MILNSERDAQIKDLVSELKAKEETEELSKCIEYMHKLWKLEVRERFHNGGKYDCITW